VNFEKERKLLVEKLKHEGIIHSSQVEKAMLKVKRELFVPEKYKDSAYVDTPLPIPGGGTISAPHMHAISLEELKLKPGEKFLEVGAGSGIVEAYVSEIFKGKGEIIGIEFIPETYEFGKKNLKKAGYTNVKFVCGDGSKGLPEEAPFDKILVSAASPDIPKPLVEQLKVNGVILAIVGRPYGDQQLVYFKKLSNKKYVRKNLLPVIFVPLRGEYGY